MANSLGMRPFLTWFVRSVLVAGAYYGTARAGLALPYFGSNVTLLWPPTGIAVAALMRFGPAMAPAVWLAAALINWQTSGSVPVAFAIATGNLLGPLVAFFVLSRPSLFHTSMDRARDVWSFGVLGAVLPMIVPPTVGVTTLVLAGVVPKDLAPSVWIVWWLGDALGVLITAPPLLTATRETLDALLHPAHRTRVLGLGVLVLGLAALTFVAPWGSGQARTPLAYVTLSFLIWTALQWGMLGGTTLVLLVAVEAGIGTALGRGPFALPDTYLGLNLLWAFLAISSLSCLLTLALSVGRARVERELSESERRLSLTMTNLPGLVYRCRNEPDWPMEFMSEKALEMTGYTASEITSGKPHYNDLIVPKDRQRVWEQVQTALSAGHPFKLEYAIRTKSGRILPCLEYGDAQRNERGEVVALEGIVFDNTERKRIEQALREAQKLESIGRLAGGIAHDFNNLLVVITGYAELIRARSPDGDLRREHAEQVLSAAERAANLTRQLLAYGRKQILQPKNVKLSDLATDTYRMLERLLGANIKVEREFRASGHVFADPSQLEQVVMNLVLNAADAMPDGGTLVLSTEDVVVARGADETPNLPAGAYVTLTVRDTGHGMDEATRERIFEPFFTTKEVGKGTGLGLATVYGIVTQSGGQLLVESAKGKGSTFRVFLPKVDPPAATPTKVEPSVLPKVSATILLVEDEPVVRAVLADVLTQEGYTVLSAEDGARAVALASAHAGAIDLVVSDVVMPGKSGPAMLRELRTRHPRLPALFVSGYARDALTDGTLDDPDVAFAQKPFTPEALLTEVSSLLPPANS